MERFNGAAMLTTRLTYYRLQTRFILGLLSLIFNLNAQELSQSKWQRAGVQAQAATLKLLEKVGLREQPFKDDEERRAQQKINQNLLEAALVNPRLDAAKRAQLVQKLVAGPLRPPHPESIDRVPTPGASLDDAFWQGAHDGNLALVQAAYEFGADPNHRKGDKGATPIWTAVNGWSQAMAAKQPELAERYQAVARYLREQLHVDESFRPRPPAKKLKLSQMRQAYNRRLDQNRGLLIIDPTQPDYQRVVKNKYVLNNLLYGAAQEGNLEQVKVAIAAGADVNYHEPDADTTPLLIAGYSGILAEGYTGHPEVVRYLLAHGADLTESGRYDHPLPYILERFPVSLQRDRLLKALSAVEPGPKGRLEWVNPLEVTDVESKLTTGAGANTKDRRAFAQQIEWATKWNLAFAQAAAANQTYREALAQLEADKLKLAALNKVPTASPEQLTTAAQQLANSEQQLNNARVQREQAFAARTTMDQRFQAWQAAQARAANAMAQRQFYVEAKETNAELQRRTAAQAAEKQKRYSLAAPAMIGRQYAIEQARSAEWNAAQEGVMRATRKQREALAEFEKYRLLSLRVTEKADQEQADALLRAAQARLDAAKTAVTAAIKRRAEMDQLSMADQQARVDQIEQSRDRRKRTLTAADTVRLAALPELGNRVVSSSKIGTFGFGAPAEFKLPAAVRLGHVKGLVDSDSGSDSSVSSDRQISEHVPDAKNSPKTSPELVGVPAAVSVEPLEQMLDKEGYLVQLNPMHRVALPLMAKAGVTAGVPTPVHLPLATKPRKSATAGDLARTLSFAAGNKTGVRRTSAVLGIAAAGLEGAQHSTEILKALT